MIRCGARGSIINISSTAGLNGTGAVHYCSSKAAVLGFTKCLARELGGRGIRVNAICPGAMNTRMMASISPDYAKAMIASIPLGRMGEPVEVANTALFLRHGLTPERVRVRIRRAGEVNIHQGCFKGVSLKICLYLVQRFWEHVHANTHFLPVLLDQFRHLEMRLVILRQQNQPDLISILIPEEGALFACG